jgi:tetratricopeptide (TPR) repeat protein
MQSLLYTFLNARTAMQSTILSQDFYAAFCTLYLPFALLMMFDPGAARHSLVWRFTAFVTAVLTAISILVCNSKGEYIFGALSCLLFLGGYLWIVFNVKAHGDDDAKGGGALEALHIQRRHVVTLIVGFLLLVGLMAWLKSPELIARFKSLQVSVSSRGIIWAGSLGIFQDHWLIGGGPGTFRIYFPLHRAPNYFENEISNVTLFSHNLALDMLAETGLIGFGFFVLAMGAMMLTAAWWIVRHPNPRMRALLLATFCGLLAMFGSNMSSPNGRWVIGGSSLWTAIGLMIGLLTQARATAKGDAAADAAPGKDDPRGRDRDSGLKWTLPACALFLLLFGAMAGLLVYGKDLGNRYFASQREYLIGLQYMESADKLLRDGQVPIEEVVDQFQTARDRFDAALRIDPAGYSTYYKQGSVYTTLASIAIDQLRQRMARNELTREQTAALLGDIATKLARSRRVFEDLYALWPRYAELDYNLTIIYNLISNIMRTAAGQGFEPLAAFSEMTEDPDVLERKALQHAIEMRRMSIKPEVAILLGGQYERLNRAADAVKVYQQAIAEDNISLEMLRAYHDAAARAGDIAAQVDALERLWDLTPLDDAMLNQALNLAIEHRLDDRIVAMLQKLEKANPVDPRLAEAPMRQAMRDNRPEAFLQAFARLKACGGAQDQTLEAARIYAQQAGVADRIDPTSPTTH